MVPPVLLFPSTHASLITKLQEREAEAWAQFFGRYQRVILNWCARKGLPLSDAEDLAQNFMADAPRKLRTYELVNCEGQPNRFRSWLKTVIDRKVIDFRRAVANRSADHATGDDRLLSTIDEVFSRNAIRDMTGDLAEAFDRDIETAVASIRGRIKPDTWAAYERYELLDESPKAIAESLGKTVGAVFVAVNRVNSMLAEYGSLLTRRPRTTVDSEGRYDPVPEQRRTPQVRN